MKKLLVTIFLPLIIFAGELENPGRYLDVEVGADRTLIDWNEISSYCKYVAENSGRVMIQPLGKTTLGREFFMTVISSEENLARLPEIRMNQRKLARGVKFSDAQIEKLVSETPLILLVTFNIHSTEIGSSQAAVEILYELAAEGAPDLQNLVILLVPSVNPDGQQMVVDWYREYVHTSYEGAPMPHLYHHYAGHDNNRDWHYFNLTETRALAGVLYNEWFPEIVYDQHQMGSQGPRIFLPPYADPVNPVIPAQLTAQVNFIGEKVVSDLHSAGYQGIATGTIFNAYFQGTLSKTPLWHNRIGILCEVASTRIATPVFFPYGSFNSFGPDLPEYKTQTNFLDPWPGGWWRLRDIMDLEKSVLYAITDVASTYAETIKRQFVKLNMINTQKGSEEPPFGYFIPAAQRDRSVLMDMLNKLQTGGVRIDTLTAPARLGLHRFETGTFYISCAQPERNYIIDLFQVHHYPELLMYPEGPPLEPYDVTTWNMPLQMGIEVIENDSRSDPARAPVENISTITLPGTSSGKGDLIVFGPGSNWSVPTVLQLLNQHKKVWQAAESFDLDQTAFPAGSFIVDGGKEVPAIIERLSLRTIDARQIERLPQIELKSLEPSRIGLYQPYYPSMDEGWTRWVLDTYQIDFRTVDTDQLGNGSLADENDVLIIPSIRTGVLTRGLNAYRQKNRRIADINIPPKYAAGIGKNSLAGLRQFLNAGGRVIILHRSIPFFTDSLGLPVSVLNAGLPQKEFFIPGALLNMDLDPTHYIGYGLPEKVNVFYDSQGPVMKLLPYLREVATPGVFPKNDLLASGWCMGEKWLHDRVGIVDIPVGQGNVILFGFRPQHRGQTHGTFALLFNGLIR